MPKNITRDTSTGVMNAGRVESRPDTHILTHKYKCRYVFQPMCASACVAFISTANYTLQNEPYMEHLSNHITRDRNQSSKQAQV
jgi:hypothetical protein